MDIDSAKIKSYWVQFLLCFLLGYIGLLYSSKSTTLFALFMNVVVAPAMGYFLGFQMNTFKDWYSVLVAAYVYSWPMALLASYFCVKANNETAESYIRLRQKRDKLNITNASDV